MNRSRVPGSLLLLPKVRHQVVAAWVVVLITIAAMATAFGAGNDAKAYERTVREVQAGSSCYASGIERLRSAYGNGTKSRTMNYIYPPVTLQLVRAAGWAPAWFRNSAFWLLYAAGIFLVFRMEELLLFGARRSRISALVPLCVFFPGLLNDDYVLAGNITPILYGMISAAAMWDWKHRQWRWFYLTVLVVALFKPTMLTLLAIPVLTAAGQWLKTLSVAVLGCVVFLAQQFIWPDAFKAYAELMNLEFLYNHEFGFSLAGQLGQALLNHRLPYKHLLVLFYICYAIAVFVVLFLCSRQYLQRRISAQRWYPVLLIGVILLNPRLKQYDAAVITLPLAVVMWHLIADLTPTRRQATIAFISVLAVANVLAGVGNSWDAVETMLTSCLFIAALWSLLGGLLPRAKAAEQAAEPHAV